MGYIGMFQLLFSKSSKLSIQAYIVAEICLRCSRQYPVFPLEALECWNQWFLYQQTSASPASCLAQHTLLLGSAGGAGDIILYFRWKRWSARINGFYINKPQQVQQAV